MTQTDIFAAVTAAPTSTSTTTSSALSVKYDLPVETIIDGRLRCRHHPGEIIREHGAPCRLCWAEGRGIAPGLLADQGDEEGGPR